MSTRTSTPIFFFLSHPIQYFSPFLQEAAKVLNLSVWYFSDNSVKGTRDRGFGQNIKWDIPLLEGYSYTFLTNYSFRKSLENRLLDLINPGIFRVLFSKKGKIFIVNDWSYLTTFALIILGRVAGKKIWLRVESNHSIEERLPVAKKIIKRLFLQHFLFKYFIDKHLFIGKGNRRFLQFYGVREDKLIYTPYAVDNSFFRTRYAALKPRTAELRSKWNVPHDHVVIIFSGKLIPRKRPFDLLDAFQRVHREDVTLLFIGDGELRAGMEAEIYSRGLRNVQIMGFVNQGGISEMYAMGDIFVLCSEEDTWGLVVNEAMNFHMPVVVSDRVGCAEDLVLPGETGYVYEKGNTVQLASYLTKLIEDPALRRGMGERAAQKVAEYDYQIGIENISTALN